MNAHEPIHWLHVTHLPVTNILTNEETLSYLNLNRDKKNVFYIYIFKKKSLEHSAVLVE